MSDISTVVAIPRQLSPLIGRERELRLIQETLQHGNRLVTITGIGGIGKTRLALQVALEMEPAYTNGAVFVALAEVREASLIPFEISRVLGNPNPLADTGSITNALGSGSQLLILDNLEQIPDAGTVILSILEQQPALTILCTSQFPLHVQGENVFPLDPMPTPPVDAEITTEELRGSPAVSLFLQRAQAANPYQEFDTRHLQTVADICRTLDGIPLAIELAAGRISILSPTELQSRLANRFEVLAGGSSDLPDRLRTMHNAIEWSYSLLDKNEQRIFRYLGIYAGSISLEAMQHTLQTLEITKSTLDMLDFLVTRGLLRRLPNDSASPRYQMLQTIREFALAQLRQNGDEPGARLAHAHYIVDRAEEAEPHLTGEKQETWFRELNADLDNIRAACEWATENRPEITLRVIASIWRLFQFNSIDQQFIDLGRRSLQHDLPYTVLAKGWSGVGLLEGGLRLNSTQSFENAIHYADIVGDDATKVRSLSGLGMEALNRVDLDTAYRYYTQTRSLNEATNNQHGIHVSLMNLAIIHSYRGEYEIAQEMMLEAIAVADRTGDRAVMARGYANLSIVCEHMDKLETGYQYALKTLEISQELNNQADMYNALWRLASCSHALGNLEIAEQYIQEALPIGRKAGRIKDELNLRTISVEIHLDRQDFAAANHEIIAILEQCKPELNPETITACAGSLLVYAYEYPDRVALAELLGSVRIWRTQQSDVDAAELDPAVQATYDALISNPASETSQAYTAAESWSSDQLKQAALRVARSMQDHLPAVSAELTPPPPAILTPREREVLAMMAKGHTNAEIAEEMFISLRTITTHASNIFAKLDVKNRSMAVAIAMQAGML